MRKKDCLIIQDQGGLMGGVAKLRYEEVLYKMGRPIWHFKHILDMAASFGLPGPKSILTPMGGHDSSL